MRVGQIGRCRHRPSRCRQDVHARRRARSVRGERPPGDRHQPGGASRTRARVGRRHPLIHRARTPRSARERPSPPPTGRRARRRRSRHARHHPHGRPGRAGNDQRRQGDPRRRPEAAPADRGRWPLRLTRQTDADRRAHREPTTDRPRGTIHRQRAPQGTHRARGPPTRPARTSHHRPQQRCAARPDDPRLVRAAHRR